MHSYTKGNVKLFNIYKWLLLISFIFSLLIGYLIKHPDVKNFFSIFNLFFAGMPFLVIFLIYKLFIKWAWKWKYFNEYINVPDINGTYKGILKGSFDDFSKEREFKLKIKQDFENISITMEMLEKTSMSYSINAYLEQRNNEIYLIYNYQNEPIDKTSPTLTEHKGTAILRFNLANKSFKGNYYTDKRPINEKDAKCNFGEIWGEVNNATKRSRN